jgi:hypothetical protein
MAGKNGSKWQEQMAGKNGSKWQELPKTDFGH